MSAPSPSEKKSQSQRISALVIDMDGVLWLGDTPLPGLNRFFDLLNSQNVPYILATNNASRWPQTDAERLKALGVAVDPDRILTSGLAASYLLPSHCPPPGPIFIIGTENLSKIFSNSGYDIVEQGDDARAVVVGFDRQLTWQKLAEAALALSHGAFFMGTNPDPSFPSERGLVPGNGAQLAALTAATGLEPFIVGKPEPSMYALAMKKLGTAEHETLAVGDRLETDILGGARAGLQTALLLSGVSTRSDLAGSPVQPDYIFADLVELAAFLAEHWQS